MKRFLIFGCVGASVLVIFLVAGVLLTPKATNAYDAFTPETYWCKQKLECRLELSKKAGECQKKGPESQKCMLEVNKKAAQCGITDAVVQFATSSSSGSESVRDPKIELVLSATTTYDMTVWTAVSSLSTATRGADYVLSSPLPTFFPGIFVTFPAYKATTSIPMSVIDDVEKELNETVMFNLVNCGSAGYGTTTSHTYTIIDND